ncbi:hypothetical protein N7533_010768 [Penicillium manginii]|uniref:uncharacterized protein n=1 Tax=Penicillium manginii TaxID=203109 RepID=UPI002546F1D6|nr:uncharacterized protein N7533_010768 [Penicillium manginii]KAJ5741359.1 hypothetical protein N7533_010768 [Penicillium manginii]
MAPKMMKAAVLKEHGKPLVIEQVPVPTPEGRHVLVRVLAASLCHSDLTIIQGKVAASASTPLILGHEAVVEIEALGPEAAKYGLKVGDRVGAPLWQDWCLDCHECKAVGTEFCAQLKMRGVTSPGFFAEYTTMDAASAVVIPRDSPATAAQLSPIFCAGITVWDALTRAELRPGETVAIAFGAKVIAIDVHDGQLESVKAGGSADEILNTRDLEATEVIARIRELNSGRGVDAAVVTSGSKAAYLTALSILSPLGRLMAVGIPLEEVPINPTVIALRALKIIGAKVPGQIGTAACVEFSQRKGIYPKVNPRKFQLEDINEMIDLMGAGKVEEGRMVIQFS